MFRWENEEQLDITLTSVRFDCLDKWLCNSENILFIFPSLIYMIYGHFYVILENQPPCHQQ